jgi:hypothetical protein
MNSDAELLLRNGRFVRRTFIEYDLGSQDHLLEKLADSQCLHIHDFMSFNDTPLHLMVQKQKLLVLSQLKKLPFTTYWSIDPANPKHLTTIFKPVRGAVKIEDSFPIPESWGTLLFAVQFNRTITPAYPEACYLFLYREGELYWFPYPNLFDNGKVCMGEEWDRKPTLKKDLITDFIHAHTTFHQTQMNDHLTTQNTQKLFARCVDGWSTPDNAVDYFRSVSNALMQGFSL